MHTQMLHSWKALQWSSQICMHAHTHTHTLELELNLKPDILGWCCPTEDVSSLSMMKTGCSTSVPYFVCFLWNNQWQVVHINGLFKGGAITCWSSPSLQKILHLVWCLATLYQVDSSTQYFFISVPPMVLNWHHEQGASEGLFKGGAITCWSSPSLQKILHLVWCQANLYFIPRWLIYSILLHILTDLVPLMELNWHHEQGASEGANQTIAFWVALCQAFGQHVLTILIYTILTLHQ